LGTGHLAPDEIPTLLRAARDLLMTKMLATHPWMPSPRFSRGQMRAAADFGALLEFDYLSCSPNWHAAVPPSETAAAIHAVGPEHCVLGTDGGQTFNPHPADMLRDFAAALAGHGVPEPALREMMCANPARILGLE
jgi:hypothetical protein